MESSRPSCCSELKEVNEAKVANILAYLDGTVAASTGGDNSGIPLTVSALRNNTTYRSSDAPSLPSSIHLHHTVGAHQRDAAPPLTSAPHDPPASAQATYLGIKKKIASLVQDKEELLHENRELRGRLESWKALDEERRVELQRAVKSDVDELRAELEATKRRSSQQLKKLSEEREQLQHRVDALSSQLRQEMLRREEERQKLEAANTAAVGALKAKWQAQEKAAREKWRLAEAKRIKETTLQSLEPDIVLLLNRHKAEKARMREEFENELRHRDEAIAARDATAAEVKARLQRDTEATLAREQASYEARLREETERVRRQLEEERRSEKAQREQMASFFEEEKSAMRREIARLGRENLDLRGAQSVEQASFHEAVATEVARVTGQSTDIVASLKEKLMLEFACREREAEAKNAKYLQAREAELRRQCDIDRDAAIAKVVQRLEEEHVRALTSARGSDGLLRDRYSQLSRDKERLQVELELTQEQLKEAMAVKRRHEEEIAALKEAGNVTDEKVKAIEERVRAQFRAKVDTLDNVWQGRLLELETQHAKDKWAAEARVESLTRELEVAQRRAEQEQRTVEQKHHTELHQINERVLVAITHKEATIKTQAEQILSLQEAIAAQNRELERHRTLLQ